MISSELAELLEPQERFDALAARARRLGPKLIDLSYASPPRTPGAVRRILADSISESSDSSLQYTPPGGSRVARRAVAESLTRSHQLPFRWQDVVLTPGATAALAICLQALGEPGGEVIVPTPCWLDYPLYTVAAGQQPVAVEATADCDLDLDAVAAAVSTATTAVILSDPVNPTGRCIGCDRWQALAELLERWRAKSGNAITVIADEAHRDLVDAPGRGASAIPDTILVYSFGKYHCIQGQRAGYAAVSPRHSERDRLRVELRRWARILGFAVPDASMQAAIPRLLEVRHDFSHLRQEQMALAQSLEQSGFEVVQADGTYFLYVRTPGRLDDFQWAERLLETQHLLVAPAPLFHHHGYFRIALTAAPETLQLAASKLANGYERCLA
jgi:aspartate aminotransferase